MFSEPLLGLCLGVLPPRSLKVTHVFNTRDLEWSSQWGGWICALVVSGTCQARRFSPGHRCLGKFLPEGLWGFTSSCCLRDLVPFLVSQKPLFLGSRCCPQPCPVIAGHQGSLFPGCALIPGQPTGVPAAVGGSVGGELPKHTQLLSPACF